MSDFQHKPNSGSLFINSYKTSDSQPAWKGTCLVGGEEFAIAAWENEGRNGVYLSLRFEPKADADRRAQEYRDRNVGSRQDSAPPRSAPRRTPEQEAAVRRAQERVRYMGHRQGGLPNDGFADDDIPF